MVAAPAGTSPHQQPRSSLSAGLSSAHARIIATYGVVVDLAPSNCTNKRAFSRSPPDPKARSARWPDGKRYVITDNFAPGTDTRRRRHGPPATTLNWSSSPPIRRRLSDPHPGANARSTLHDEALAEAGQARPAQIKVSTLSREHRYIVPGGLPAR